MTRPASPHEIAVALGGGKEQRTAGGWKTLCPLHRDTNPSLIIYEKGDKDGKPWATCASCGSSKDLYDSIEKTTGMHFEARRAIGDNQAPHNPPNSRKSKVKAVYPASIPWHPVHLKARQPTQHWEYYNADGALMFVSARYDFPEGKQFRQYSVVYKGGQPVWFGVNQCNPLPLYNLKEVLDNPDWPVLVVEGEKTADYAKSMPEFAKTVVVTFAAGSKSWKKTDWSPLKGRKVFLWPDADVPGKDAFVNLGKYLWSIADNVEMAHVPTFFPKGWDLADPFPEDWNIRKITWKAAYKPDRQYLLQSVTPANYVEVFNSLYYVYHDGTKTHTISKEFLEARKGHPVDVGRPGFIMLVGPHHEADRCCRINVDDNHWESALRFWAANKLQAGEYINDFNFRPDIDQEILDGYRWSLNTWTGLPYTPSADGSCQKFKTFLMEVICANDNEAYRYLWNFLSHMFKYPHEKPDLAIMLNGEKGTGKSFLFGVLGRLLGGSDGYSHNAPSSLIFKGDFNSAYAANTLALFVHEWQNTTSIAIENSIKSFITEDVVEVKIKYRNNYQSASYTRVFGASNHDHMARVTTDERRYSFFNVSSVHMQDIEYFAAINNEMLNGGFQRLLHEFLETEVNKNLVKTIYRNTALAEQKELSRTPAQELAYDLLTAGEVFLRTLDDRRDVESFYHATTEEWNNSIAVPYALVTEIIKTKYRPKNGEAYSRKNPAVSVSGMVSWLTNETDRSSCYIMLRGERKRVGGYRIPSLEECRQYYANKVGLSYDALFADDRGTVVDLPVQHNLNDGDAPF